MIRGDYEQLEKDFNDKNLSKEVEDHLRAILKLLEIIGVASKRILEKMNPSLLRIVKGMGLKEAEDVQQAHDEPVASKISPFDKDYVESEFGEREEDEEDD